MASKSFVGQLTEVAVHVAPTSNGDGKPPVKKRLQACKPGVYWLGDHGWHRHDVRTERLVFGKLSNKTRPQIHRSCPWPRLLKPRKRFSRLGTRAGKPSLIVDSRWAGTIATRRQPEGFGFIIDLTSMEQVAVHTNVKTPVKVLLQPKLLRPKKEAKEKTLPCSSDLNFSSEFFQSPPSHCTRSKSFTNCGSLDTSSGLPGETLSSDPSHSAPSVRWHPLAITVHASSPQPHYLYFSPQLKPQPSSSSSSENEHPNVEEVAQSQPCSSQLL